MASQPAKKHQRASYWTPVLLTIAVLLLYLAFRSISLDDFDSYSFALALDHFDLGLQQPQPPGFPVYIFLGRALYRLTGNATAALTLLSALSGTGTALLVYALGRRLDDDSPLTGVLAAFLVALTPLGWLTAEKALSDALGLCAILLPMWLLTGSRKGAKAAKPSTKLQVPVSGTADTHETSHIRRPEDGATSFWGKGKKLSALCASARALCFAAFTTGLALGVRPQNALPLALLWIVVIVRLWTTDVSSASPLGKIRLILLAALCGLIGIAAWLLPIAATLGGLPAYLDHIRDHAGHVGRADSLLGMGLPPITAIRARALAFGDTFLTSTIGVGTFASWTLPQTLTALIAGAFVLVALLRADWRRRAVQGLALWTVVVTAQVFLFENLDRPRLLLPILPPLALLVAHGWSRVRRPRWLALAVTIAAAVGLLVQGIPLAAHLAAIPAPPAQATAYVAARFPPEETLIATAGSFRAVQVELPAYPQAYLYRFDADAVQRTLADDVRYIVIFDRDQFPADALATLNDDGRYVPLEEHTFTRDRRVHTQHDQVRVQVLTPAELVPPEALVLPEDGCIDVGSPNDGRYLAQGWFRPEAIGGAQGRWAGETLTSTVRVALEPGMATRLRFRALAYPEEQAVTVFVGGHKVERFNLAQGWTEYTMELPADTTLEDDITTLTLVHALARTPFDATGGSSSDTRALTAAYDWVCFEKAP